jgi:hypothetical protein
MNLKKNIQNSLRLILLESGINNDDMECWEKFLNIDGNQKKLNLFVADAKENAIKDDEKIFKLYKEFINLKYTNKTEDLSKKIKELYKIYEKLKHIFTYKYDILFFELRKFSKVEIGIINYFRKRKYGEELDYIINELEKIKENLNSKNINESDEKF